MADEGSNPLDRTPDMEGLSAADRARIYKERAAAAGLGRAPGPGGESPPASGQPAARPPAQQPAAQPPQQAAASAGGEAPEGGSAPQRPAASAGAAGGGGDKPLGKSGDMAGLSAAERARIYKERAAAAGIGRAPNPEAGGGQAAPPPAERPAAPAGGDGAPARPAAAAAGAGAGSAAAPAGARAAAAGALTPEQRERLAAAAQRDRGGPTAAASPAAEQQQRLVYVWPHLVTIEFLASVLAFLSMIVISFILQSPLEGHANPDKTPNPSKAPWYFLNLQELLLHMHPALAGVIVPTGALALIAAIPYFDRDTRDVGKWFGTPKSIPIAWFTTWYTTIVLIVEIIFDEFIGLKPTMGALERATGLGLWTSVAVADVLIPTILMLGPILPLVWLIQRIYKPDGVRDWMICLFTGFFVAYIVLTIFGTFFRGQGMHLFWPWDARMIRIE